MPFYKKSAVLSFISYNLLSITAILILNSNLSLEWIIQLFGVLVLIIVIVSYKFASRLQIISIPVSMAVFILIAGTGGISSPFIILSHLLALALAILVSPNVALTYIVSSSLLIILSFFIDPNARDYVTENLFPSILYMVAYAAFIPFSYVLAREYKTKDKWIKDLEKQITNSQTEEEALLKNINDIVIVLDSKFQIAYQNKKSGEFFKYSDDIIGKNFFDYFSFKNENGRDLPDYSLPFTQTLNSKLESRLENIQIAPKGKVFTKISIKILPVANDQGPLGIVLIIEDQNQTENIKTQKQLTARVGLSRFLLLLGNQKRALELFRKKSGPDVQNLVSLNQDLESLARDFIYSLQIESGEIGTIADLVDLGKIVEDLIFDQKEFAASFNIKLEPSRKIIQDKITSVRSDLRIGIARHIFGEIFILANTKWLQDSLGRIIKLTVFLSLKNQTIEIGVTKDNDIAQITIRANFVSLPATFKEDLFAKFYGNLRDTPNLSRSTGLEGYIAKSLISRMGGSINLETEKQQTLIKVTFGLGPQSQNTPQK